MLPETLAPVTLRCRFLECPLQAAKQLLKLQDDDGDDLLDREDEPFCTELLERVQLLRGGFVEKLAREARGEPASFEAVYDARGERLVASGRMPTGVLREVEREGHLAVLRDWERLLREGLGDEACRPERVRFGAAADEHDGADDTFDPIVVASSRELGPERPGCASRSWRDRALVGAPRSLTLIQSQLDRTRSSRRWGGQVSLRGFVDAVRSAGAGRAAQATSRSSASPTASGKARAYSFVPSAATRRSPATQGVADMLSGFMTTC